MWAGNMTPEQFRQLQALFDDVLVLPASEREAWARSACRDPSLLAALLRLIEAEDATADALEASLRQSLDDAAREIIDSDWAEGAMVGRYRLIREIGRGGMGRVFEAEFVEGDLRQRVAVKVLHRDVATESLRRRFFRERRMLGALRHPGIARLIDIGQTEAGDPFLVMDLVEGAPINVWCAQRKLPLLSRVSLFAQVLRAVSHAHRNLILHRDLKPANVLVDADGQVRLLDFGVAKMIDGRSEQTQAHERLLTPLYASPEQLVGEDCGVASDIYSSGVLLHELLAGVTPFRREGIGAAEFERQVREEPPERLRRAFDDARDSAPALGVDDVASWSRSLDGDLDAIVQKALSKRPEDRYRSADEFESDLVAYIDKRPVVARTPTVQYRFSRFIARNRYAVVAGTAFGVAAMIGSVAYVQQSEATRRERDRAQAAVAVLRDAFRAADPMRAGGSDLSAQSVLRGAGERLLPSIAADPQTYLPVAIELAETQLALGMVSDGAADWIDRATAHDHAGGASQELALGLLRARLQFDRDQPKEAEQTLEQLERLAPADPSVALLKARLLILRARWDDVERLLTPLLEQPGVDQRELVEVTWQLAEALRRNQQAVRAGDLLSGTDAQLAQHLGESHPLRLVTRLRLANVELSAGNPNGALTRLDGMRADVVKRFGTASTTYALFQTTRGRALSAERRFGDAADAFGEAANAYAASLGPASRNAIRTRFNEVQSLAFSPNRVPEAREALPPLLVQVRETMPETDPLRLFIETEGVGLRLRAADANGAREALLALAQRDALERSGADDQAMEEFRAEWSRLADKLASTDGCRSAPTSDAGLISRLEALHCERTR